MKWVKLKLFPFQRIATSSGHDRPCTRMDTYSKEKCVVDRDEFKNHEHYLLIPQLERPLFNLRNKIIPEC